MFELKQAKAKLAGFNPRAEKHGDENKMAGDLTVHVNLASDALAVFHPDLRAMLFRQPSLGEQQPLLGGDKLTALNLPRLNYPLKFNEEFPGYEVEILSGLGLTESLLFVDVKLKAFAVTPIEGGSIAIAFNAIVHPDEEEAGQLCALIQEEIELNVTPPKKQAETQPDLEGVGAAPGDQLQQAADGLEKAAA